MGWQSDDAPGHEGYLKGLVLENPDDPTSWRELGYPRKDEARDRVDMFQVACDCGWRSPRLRAPPGTSWTPSTLQLPPYYEDDLRQVAAELWRQHWRLPDALAARAETRVPRASSPGARGSADTSPGGRLELVDEPGGLRHVLLGRPVHAADALDLLLADGRWLPGRYENQRGDDYLRPLFYFDLVCTTASPDWAGTVPDSTTHLEASLALTDDACLRWPRPGPRY